MKVFKIIAVLLFIGASSYTAYAQDILFKKDGSKDSVIVQEVTPVEIVYKKYSRPKGPNYRIYKSKLLLIEYADGTIEVYGTKTKTAPQANSYNATNLEDTGYIKTLGRNIIAINYLHLLNGNVHLGYERITKDGIAGIKLSVNFNVDNVESGILAYQRDFTTGIDLNLYPTGQGKIKYFLGPSFRLGTVSQRFESFTRGAPVINYFNYFGVFFNNGFNIHPTPKLYIGFQGALGIGRFRSQQNSTNSTDVDGIFAFNMGYRF